MVIRLFSSLILLSLILSCVTQFEHEGSHGASSIYSSSGVQERRVIIYEDETPDTEQPGNDLSPPEVVPVPGIPPELTAPDPEAGIESGWYEALYGMYDHETFFDLDLVHKPVDRENPDLALLEAAVFYHTNLHRVEHGQPPLQYSSKVSQASRNHSQDMIDHSFFSHVSPVEGRESVRDRLLEVGASFSAWGENIITGRVSQDGTYADYGESLLRRWMNSEGHRENILRSNFTAIGVGLAGDYPDYIGTQKFIRSR